MDQHWFQLILLLLSWEIINRFLLDLQKLGNTLMHIKKFLSVFLTAYTDTKYKPLLIFFQAHVFYQEKGGCAAFLSNYDTESGVRVLFNNRHYSLPPWSISILPDCRNVVFNTAKVSTLQILIKRLK